MKKVVETKEVEKVIKVVEKTTKYYVEFDDFVKFLKEHKVLGKFAKNFAECNGRLDFERFLLSQRPCKAFEFSFGWFCTDDGDHFWVKINDLWLRFLDSNKMSDIEWGDNL